MNLSFRHSPFAPRFVSPNSWEPVKYDRYHIRSYCDTDLYACLAVWAKASWRAHRFLGTGTWLKQAWRLWRGQLQNAATWVFAQQGVVCGFISVHPRHHIAGLFVEPSRQGEGIGSRLVKYVNDVVELDRVDVYSLNLRARKFYERHGFQVTDDCPADADGAPYALLRMTRLPFIQSNPTESTRSIT